MALLLGVPLMFKRLELGEGPQREELRYETKMYVYKLMTTPGLGLPITWNQNGAGTPLPPIAVRSFIRVVSAARQPSPSAPMR